MIKEKFIGMLVSIFILLLACSEQNDNETIVNNAIMGKDKVNISLSLSSLPEVQIEGHTDYRPMSSRATGNVRSIISNSYKCLVIKEIGNKWYVDTLTQRTLTEGSKWNEIKVTDDTPFNDLQLTLRPGHYRVLVVLNPQNGKWNPNLIPGAIVKGEADTVAHAYTYNFQTDKIYANYGKRQVSREIYAGTADFTVKKTTDLHSDPIDGNTHITFTRKVMQMRFLLKDEESEKNQFNFKTTQHTVFATLATTQPEIPFCDGLDCWGNAYYKQQNPTTEIELCTCIDPSWRTAQNNRQYKMISSHVTIYSPFLFTDNTQPIPFLLKNLKVIGQSGSDGFIYIYPSVIQNLTLKNNTIQQFSFQTTDMVDEEVASPQLQVTLDYLEEESSQLLFDSYYECNIP